jgi:tRNA-Thr(GGU) m(6)t(6)A37 methyltransferase TsaA
MARLIGRDAEPELEGPVEVHAIGVVRSSYRDARRMADPTQEATIELLPEHLSALTGLDGFSHIFVLTWLDRVAEEERTISAEQPAGDPKLPEIGVLALRTHHRPNPIGVSVVPLLRVEGGKLHVRGLDAIDGTPVLDIKPYVPFYDSVPEARLPGWATDQADSQ